MYRPPIWSYVANDDYSFVAAGTDRSIHAATEKDDNWHASSNNCNSTSNGSTIISLMDRPYYVVGRDASSHIQLTDPSADSAHVVLQFRDNNQLYLFNLSPQGTTINGENIETGIYVPLNTDDVIQFNKCPQLYTLKGPDNLQSIIRSKGTSLVKQQQLQRKQKFSHGFPDSNIQEDTENAEAKALRMREIYDKILALIESPREFQKNRAQLSMLDIESMNDAQRRILQNIERNLQKYETLQHELERIELKGEEIKLTTGQKNRIQQGGDQLKEIQRALEGLQDRVDEAFNIDATEQHIRTKKHGNSTANDSDEGEIFDKSDTRNVESRVSQRSSLPRHLFSDISTLTSTAAVKENIKLSENRLKALQIVIQDLAQIEINGHHTEELDPLDKYMAELNQESLQKKEDALSAEIKELQNRLESLQQLIGKVEEREKAQALAKQMTQTSQNNIQQKSTSVQKKPSQISSLGDLKDRLRLQATASFKSASSVPANDNMSHDAGLQKMLASQFANQLSSRMKRAYESRETDRKAPSSVKYLGAPPDAIDGLYNIGSRKNDGDSDNSNSSKKQRRTDPTLMSDSSASTAIDKPEEYASVDLEDEEEERAQVWIPPKNQSGDGRTSLNAKLGY